MSDRKGENMEAGQMVNYLGKTYSLEEARKEFFRMLDEAIDEMEQGKFISEEEFWKEVDAF